MQVRLILTIWLLMTALAGAQTHIRFDAGAFNANPATNRVVEFTPRQPFLGNPIEKTTDSSGVCYLSNALPVDYSFTIRQKGSAKPISGQLTVTATNLGVVDADEITSVAGAQTYPSTGKSAWSIQASDGRYLKLSDTNGLGGGGGDAILRPSGSISIITNATGDHTPIVNTNALRAMTSTNSHLLDDYLVRAAGQVTADGDWVFGGALSGDAISSWSVAADGDAEFNDIAATNITATSLAGPVLNQMTNIASGSSVSAAQVAAIMATNSAGKVTNGFTVRISSRGIANGLSTITNDGCNYGPDTPGTTTSGIQEAINGWNKGTNYGPYISTLNLDFTEGFFFFTNALTISNLYTSQIEWRGKGILSSTLVYAGPSTISNTITFTGGRNTNSAFDFPLHISIEDMTFTSLTNSTNVLVYADHFSYVKVSDCNFTSWNVRTNQSYGSGVSFTPEVNTVVPGLVGLRLAMDYDHSTVIDNVFCAGLAVGMHIKSDHPSVSNLKFSNISYGAFGVTNQWPTNSIYSIGACVIQQGGSYDSSWRYGHVYAAKAGFAGISLLHFPKLLNWHFESATYPVLSDSEYVPTLIEPSATSESMEMTQQYKLYTPTSSNYISNRYSPTLEAALRGYMYGSGKWDGSDYAFYLRIANELQFIIDGSNGSLSGNGSGLSGIPALALESGGTLPALNGLNVTNIQATNVVGVFTHRPVSTRTIWTASTPNTATNSSTSKFRVVIADDISQVKLVYQVPTNNNVLMNIKASIEVNSVRYPVYFNNSRTNLAQGGAIIISDPVNLYLTNQSVVWVYTFVNTLNTNNIGNNVNFTSGYGGVAYGQDLVDSGTVSGSIDYIFTIASLLGRSDRDGIACLGDSIIDSPTGGFLRQAFGPSGTTEEVGNRFCLWVDSRSGNTATNWATQWSKTPMIDYCNTAITQFGINDLSGGTTFATLTNSLVDTWMQLKARGVERIYQTTITPKTTSTDSWATTNNQTLFSAHSVRTNLNNWIRTTPFPLTGYFEVAASVETGTNTGYWRASYTSDGTHPNSTGSAAMAATITTNLFR